MRYLETHYKYRPVLLLCFCQTSRSLPAPEQSFSEAVATALSPAAAATSTSGENNTNSSSRRVQRVAFSPDLGVPPVEAEVVQLCRAAADWWEQQRGAVLVEAAPDLQDMQQVFLVSHGKRSGGVVVMLRCSVGPLNSVGVPA